MIDRRVGSDAKNLEVQPHVTIVHPRTTNRSAHAWAQLQGTAFTGEAVVEEMTVTVFVGRRWRLILPLVANGSDPDFTVVHLDDCASVPAYEAELVFLRHGLGVGSLGMQVERLPAHYHAYAEHDERESGQEEIYTLLEGSARLLVAGEEHLMRPGVFARVGPTTRRKIVTDDEPALLLCLGGRPGAVYEPPAWTDPSQRPS